MRVKAEDYIQKTGDKATRSNPPARWKKGNPGRPKGARNKLPKGLKASMKALAEDILQNEQLTVRRALMRGLRGGARHADRFLRLIAEYNEGKPQDNLKIDAQFNTDAMNTAATGMRKKMDLLLATVLKQKHAREEEAAAALAEAQSDESVSGS